MMTHEDYQKVNVGDLLEIRTSYASGLPLMKGHEQTHKDHQVPAGACYGLIIRKGLVSPSDTLAYHWHLDVLLGDVVVCLREEQYIAGLTFRVVQKRAKSHHETHA